MSLSPILLAAFWLVALLNPIFKKYDYGAEFPMLIIFGVLIAIVALIEYRKKREKAYLEQFLLWLFGIFVVLSFVFSQTQNVGFSEFLAFVSVITLYSIFAFKKIPWISKFLKVVSFGTILAVMMGFYLYFMEAETRMAGPFFNILYHANIWPNAFALFLIMAWPIFLLKKFPRGDFWAYFCLGITLTALLLTFSRGALIVLGGQTLLLAFYFFKRIKIKTILVVLSVSAFSFGLFWSANYLRAQKFETIDVEEKITFDNEEGLTSVNERKDFWQGAIILAKEKPLFGWGPFSFRYAYNGIQKTFLGNSDHPHNIFLKIAAENGLPAVGIFIAFLLTTLFKVASRFKTLDEGKRDFVYILFVAVAGAFAHNLIDYNFNFFANLLLLFLFMVFVRSFVVKEEKRIKFNLINSVIAFVIAIFSIYEGALLTLYYTVDAHYLDYSFFPRNHYLNEADEAISEKNYEEGLLTLDTQLKLNPLDSQAWYLKGVMDCEQNRLEQCRENMQKALKLNPMNNFSYYRDYLRILDADEAQALAATAFGLVNNYFHYVENNVHFTAYTTNVEAAAELVDLLRPYTTDAEFKDLLDKKSRMLQTADRLRKNKTF